MEEILVTVVAGGVVMAGTLFLARSHGALGYWTVGRIAGFVAYGLLTVAVALGIFMSLRWRTFGTAWLLAERLHPILLLSAGAILLTHVAGFLLIGFPAAAALLPIASDFRSMSIVLGILSAYIGLLLITSTYVIRLIGYGLWRFLHYLGFVAWSFALVHGLASGHDSGARFALAYYAAGGLLIGVLLVLRFIGHIASLRPPILASLAPRVGDHT